MNLDVVPVGLQDSDDVAFFRRKNRVLSMVFLSESGVAFERISLDWPSLVSLTEPQLQSTR